MNKLLETHATFQQNRIAKNDRKGMRKKKMFKKMLLKHTQPYKSFLTNFNLLLLTQVKYKQKCEASKLFKTFVFIFNT